MTENRFSFPDTDAHPHSPALGDVAQTLEISPVTTSAPCRIDFGGTLDISSFYCALQRFSPLTVNIALNRRTTVRLGPAHDGQIRISAKGIIDAVFEPGRASYAHPLGLMAAIVDYFGARGLHVEISSASPPRSGLGGSSVAAVALIAAFSRLRQNTGMPGLSRDRIVLLAHTLEQAMAGVNCGFQDHLAAAYGGVHAWYWSGESDPPFSRRPLLEGPALSRLNPHLLVADLGVTHVSGDVNRTWVEDFIQGKHRDRWKAIVQLTHDFSKALSGFDIPAAAAAMNAETAIRRAMTPHVLESMGAALAEAAIETGCGARFTGAGAGGCLWAIGEIDAIFHLKEKWGRLLKKRPGAGLMECEVDPTGVR